MKRTILLILFFLLCFGLPAQSLSKVETGFIQGIDLSSLSVVEKNGGEFFNNNQPTDVVNLFKEKGANFVRLRLWHSPADINYNLDYNLELAQRIKDAGLNLLLDIFYSDTWADPSSQTKPAAWQSLSFEELKDSVFDYTAKVISTFKSQGFLPQMVQLGNEINCGILWPDGNVCEDDSNWNNFAQLLQSAYEGLQSVLTPSDSVKIIIHSASGGNIEQTRWFYDNLVEQGVVFDIIGLSYYPWWHGTLDDLQSNLNDAALRYGKEIIVVETAYPWTLEWNDDTHNSVGMESQLLDGYPATPEGQKQFLLDEIEIIKNVSNDLGAGWFYWAPTFITSNVGSPWENLTMFDFDGNVLPAIEVFSAGSVSVEDELQTSFQLFQNYPNPFNPSTTIGFSIPESGNVRLTIYNSLGQEVKTLVQRQLGAGEHQVNFNAGGLPSGLYIYQIDVDDKFSSNKKMLLIK